MPYLEGVFLRAPSGYPTLEETITSLQGLTAPLAPIGALPKMCIDPQMVTSFEAQTYAKRRMDRGFPLVPTQPRTFYASGFAMSPIQGLEPAEKMRGCWTCWEVLPVLVFSRS